MAARRHETATQTLTVVGLRCGVGGGCGIQSGVVCVGSIGG